MQASWAPADTKQPTLPEIAATVSCSHYSLLMQSNMKPAVPTAKPAGCMATQYQCTQCMISTYVQAARCPLIRGSARLHGIMSAWQTLGCCCQQNSNGCTIIPQMLLSADLVEAVFGKPIQKSHSPVQAQAKTCMPSAACIANNI